MVPERLKALVEEVSEVGARFAGAGKTLYLVGGVVRDAILDRLDPDGRMAIPSLPAGAGERRR